MVFADILNPCAYILIAIFSSMGFTRSTCFLVRATCEFNLKWDELSCLSHLLSGMPPHSFSWTRSLHLPFACTRSIFTQMLEAVECLCWLLVG